MATLSAKDQQALLATKSARPRARRSRSVCLFSSPKDNAEAALHMGVIQQQLHYLGLYGSDLDTTLEYLRSKCPHTSELKPYCQTGRSRGDARSTVKPGDPPNLLIRKV